MYKDTLFGNFQKMKWLEASLPVKKKSTTNLLEIGNRESVVGQISLLKIIKLNYYFTGIIAYIH